MTELRLRIEGAPVVLAALASRQEAVLSARKLALSDSVMTVLRKVSLNLTGRVLRVQTGRLRQSMQTFVAADGSSATVGTNVEYARIHELGGTTRPHDIRPTRAGALLFAAPEFIGPTRRTRKGKIAKIPKARLGAGSGLVFAGAVLHRGATMPARPYMRPALEDSRAEIQTIFMRRLAAALRRKA